MKHWDEQAAGADAQHRGNKHIKRMCNMQVLWAGGAVHETVGLSEIRQTTNLDLN